jgi:zinc protease
MAYAISAGNRPPETLVAPLRAEMARLARGPVSIAELDKVKTQMLTATLSSRQTPEGRAEALGWAMVHHHDPAQAQRELADLQAVQATDVQRVLRSYVLDRPAVTLLYTQAAETPATAPGTPNGAQAGAAQ